MDEKQLKIQHKLYALILCSVVFTIFYNYSAWHTLKLENVSSFAFDFEKYIPFISWTIIPYMTSGVFFCLVFFFCKTKEQLIVLTKRMLFVTLVAGICFLLFPLQFSLPKPEINSSIFRITFHFLKIFDSPFNQAPSLHIVYAFIFWSVFKNFNRGRIFLMILLILLGISTLTTYQHHLIDILSGAVLAHLSFIIFPYRKNDFKYRNFQVANYYFLFGWIFLGMALLINQFLMNSGSILLWITLWISFILFIIGYYYQKNNIHFLKDKNGNISLLKKIFYFPYLLMYWLFWKFLRKNRKPIEILPNLYISSKPSQKDLFHFNVDKNTFVYDLSSEIEETKALKESTKYQSVPFLDIGSFDIEQTKKLVTEITNHYNTLPENGKILIHCTMGFTRSSVIGILVMKNTLSLSIEEAVNKMKILNKSVILHSYVLDFLKKI